MDPTPVVVSQEFLRDCVLKAYHETESTGAKPALDAMRQFLSGAPGGAVARGYWFEQDPPSSAKSLMQDLEAAKTGLAALVFTPVLAQFGKAREDSVVQLAPNLAVFVSSVAGAVAVKAEIDEGLACALIATAIIGISVAGEEIFVSALQKETDCPDAEDPASE